MNSTASPISTGTSRTPGCSRAQTRNTWSTKPCPTAVTPWKSSTTTAKRSSPDTSRFASERETNVSATSNSRTTQRVVSNSKSWV